MIQVQFNCGTYPIGQLSPLKLPKDSQCIQLVAQKVLLFQMLEETSISTLLGKVPLRQKCQNNVFCGIMNTDVPPYILKIKFFLKNTCSTIASWIHVSLL